MNKQNSKRKLENDEPLSQNKKPCVESLNSQAQLETNDGLNGYFYNREELNEKLKCPCCKKSFQDPRILPCGDSICFDCIYLVVDLDNNKLLKCPTCDEIHKNLEKNKLPRNKALKDISNIKLDEVRLSNFAEELKINLSKLKIQLNDFKFMFDNREKKISEHCNQIRLRIDLATEKVKQQIDLIHDKLFDEIKNYECECLLNQQSNEDELKRFESVWNQTNCFYTQMLENAYQPMYEDFERGIQTTSNCLLQLKQELYDLQAFIFKNRQMDFVDAECSRNCEIIGLGSLVYKLLGNDLSKFENVLELKLGESSRQVKYELVDYLNEKKCVLIKRLGLDYYINVINPKNGSSIKTQFLYTYDPLCAFEPRFYVESYVEREKILLAIETDDYLLKRNKFSFQMYDLSLKKLGFIYAPIIRNLIAMCLTETKFYMLVKSMTHVRYMTIYDENLNQLCTKGLDAHLPGDPFNFNPYIHSFKVKNHMYYLLSRHELQIMNEFTGVLVKSIQIEASMMTIYNDSFLLALNLEKGQLTYFDLNGSFHSDFKVKALEKLNPSDLIRFSKNRIVILDKENKMYILS